MSDEDTAIDDLDPAELLEQGNAAVEAGENEIAAKIFNAVGNIYMSVAEYEEALKCFKDSLDIYTELKDESGVSDALYNLGVAQINLEQWDEAAKSCEKAMKLFQKTSNDDGAADAMYALALAKHGLGEFDQALAFFKKAQKAYKAVDNQQGVASTIMDVGNAYADKEDWVPADKEFKKALKIYRLIDDKAGIADALSLLGDIAEMNGNQKKSAEHFTEAAQNYMEAEIFDIAREVVERAEQKLWDIPKSTRRRLRRVIDDIIDALPDVDAKGEGEGEEFDEDLLDFVE
ncbi:MAG: tetratricopeptide repeat protein [Candidatus Thorarchaeota archaeon]